jgi:hypothetical protein
MKKATTLDNFLSFHLLKTQLSLTVKISEPQRKIYTFNKKYIEQ